MHSPSQTVILFPEPESSSILILNKFQTQDKIYSLEDPAKHLIQAEKLKHSSSVKLVFDGSPKSLIGSVQLSNAEFLEKLRFTAARRGKSYNFTSSLSTLILNYPEWLVAWPSSSLLKANMSRLRRMKSEHRFDGGVGEIGIEKRKEWRKGKHLI